MVSGTVNSASDGIGLPGATVLIKGTVDGTVTDIDGNYQLSVPTGETVLVFSFTGMATQEIAVGDQNVIDIEMESDIIGLSEVVVTGYGVQKKANLSGAVDNVTTEQLESRPIANLAQGLQGVSPNLNIDFDSGEPGKEAKINIRGFTSVNGGSPLILIDGVPSDETELNRLAPRDVESISVLKDASSAAIYGARAAFGVIIITTKSGTGEGVHVSYSNNLNFSKPTVIGDKITDPYIYLRLKETSTDNTPWDNYNFSDDRYEWARQRSNNPSVEGVRIDPTDAGRWEYMGNQDWTDYFLGNSNSQEHHLSISGKAKASQYFVSGSFNNTDGALKVADDFFDRYTLRGKVNFNVTDRLTMGTNIYVTNTKRRLPSYFDIFELLNFEPTDYAENPDGSWANTAVGFQGARLADGGVYDQLYNSFQTNFTASYQLVKNILTINADYTARRGNQDDTYDERKYTIGFGPELFREDGNNRAYKQAINETYNVFNVYGTFSKLFGQNHQVTAILGYNQEYSRYARFFVDRPDVISSSLPTIALATGDATVGEEILDWAVRGAFYRLNYTFADKYIVEFNGRYDGSSRFPKEKRFGFFPSASVGWRLDKEAFFNVDAINLLKIRGSYGSLGNQSVDEYGYIPNL